MVRKLKPGVAFRVPLANGASGYGVTLGRPYMAFFDRISRDPTPIETLLKYRIIFRAWVDDDPVKSGRWPVVGEIELPNAAMGPIKFFKQDAISGELSIFCSDPITSLNDTERTAAIEECETLEQFAMWYDDHIESRLLNYSEGNPNIWVESLKPKRQG